MQAWVAVFSTKEDSATCEKGGPACVGRLATGGTQERGLTTRNA